MRRFRRRKDLYEVKPNLMQMPHNCSFICTDPKGEILRSCGEMLRNNGYSVKVINLLEMEKSDCYNPFSYIREETDVVKLITNLISNTTPKGATPPIHSGKRRKDCSYRQSSIMCGWKSRLQGGTLRQSYSFWGRRK